MEPLADSTITIRSALRIAAVLFVAITIFGYILFQARNLINGPAITLLDEAAVVQHERMLHIHGTVQNVTTLTLNGRPIFTNELGVFEHTLVLENGYTIMTVRAEDRYGRFTTLTRTFVYQPNS